MSEGNSRKCADAIGELAENSGWEYLGWSFRAAAGVECITLKVGSCKYFVRVDSLYEISVFNDSFTGGTYEALRIKDAQDCADVVKRFIESRSGAVS